MWRSSDGDRFAIVVPVNRQAAASMGRGQVFRLLAAHHQDAVTAEAAARGCR